MTLFSGFKINDVIRAMVAADFLIIASTGFLAPIGAVYFSQQIVGGSIAAVGFATTIFWLSKSAFQIPVSLMADAKEGERDDFSLMIVGVVMAAAVQLGYYFFAREMWHVYVLSAVDGLAYALQVPTYLAIFTRHIDKYREGTEWMLHSNALGLGFAMAAALGGVIAERFGFRVIFLVAAIMMLSSLAVLLPIRNKLFVTDGDGRSEMAAHRKRPIPQ